MPILPSAFTPSFSRLDRGSHFRCIVVVMTTLTLSWCPFSYAPAQTLQSCLEERIQTEPYRSNFAKLEQALLESDRLPSADGAGYRALARATLERGDLTYLVPPGLELTPGEGEAPLDCFAAVTEPPTGLLGQLVAVDEVIARSRNLSPQLLIGTFLDHFPAEDWEHPLTKHLFYFYITLYAVPDYGILDELPPWSEEEPEVRERKPRNVFTVFVDAEDRITVRGEEMPLDELRAAAKRFITNPDDDPTLAESPTVAIIALQNERGTIYATYLAVYNELRDAYRELWDEMCQRKYGRPYSDDLPLEMRQEIRAAIPFVISEAEPTGN